MHLLRLTTVLARLAVAAALLASCGRPEPATLRGDRVVALNYDDGFQRWTAAVGVPSGPLEPGKSLSLPVDLDAHLPLLSAASRDSWNGIHIAVWGERLFDDAGHYAQLSNLGSSSLLTPGGLPVENTQFTPPVSLLGAHYGSPIEATVFVRRADLAMREGRLHWKSSVRVPIAANCPPGFYRFHVRVLVHFPAVPAILDMPQATSLLSRHTMGPDPNPYAVPGFDARGPFLARHFMTYLPPIRVGHPATPKLPVALLAQHLGNGVRGLLSEEDRKHFGISYRARFESRLILPPGAYPLELRPVTLFPREMTADPERGGGVMFPDRMPSYMDFTDGEFHGRIIKPSGASVAIPTTRLSGLAGPLLRPTDRMTQDFSEYGAYTVELAGWTRDQVGNRYEFGGKYRFWVALPLTFSTSSKPGTSYLEGDVLPTKVQVHPLLPAHVSLHVRYFPYSDISRLQERTVAGEANPFGYFIAPADSPPVAFPLPGEYQAEIVVSHVDSGGRLWMGSQTSAGVVAEKTPRLEILGPRTRYGAPKLDQPFWGLADRYRLNYQFPSEGRFGYFFTGCKDFYMPHRSGDVLYFPANRNTSAAANVEMVQAGRLPDDRRPLLEMFQGRPSFIAHHPNGTSPPIKFYPGALRLSFMSDVFYSVGDVHSAFQLPILSRHANGWSPYNFPENASVRNYYYFSAIRPGFSAFSLVTDGTGSDLYWDTSGNPFRDQANAGPNGDLPQDVYRVDAGLVYRDTARGISSYAAYASALVVDAPDSHNLRVTAAGEEPLLTAAGVGYPLLLGVETGAILQPGERLGLAAMVMPPVPAHVVIEMTSPSGTREVVEGSANALGMFSAPTGIKTLHDPGVYRIRATATHEGKQGGVLGLGLGPAAREYYNFVVAPNRRGFVHLGLAPQTTIDPVVGLRIPLSVDPDIHAVQVTWMVYCPGIVLDAGEKKLSGREFDYRFVPSQFAVEFPNYQVVDYVTGEKTLPKSTFLVFFFEGTDRNGTRVHDIAYAMTRGTSVLAPPVTQRPAKQTGAAPANRP